MSESEIPFTVTTSDTHLYILTDRERLVVARCLEIAAAMTSALGDGDPLLVELRDRFCPEGLDTVGVAS